MSAQTSIGANDGFIQTAVVGASTGPFAVDFPFFALDDVIVTVLTAAGAKTTLVRGVDYTLTATANDDGIFPSGTVNLTVAVSNSTVTRYRVTSLTRASQLPLTGYLNRTALNADLNKQIMALQDQLRIGYGTIRFPEEDGNAAADKILPPESQAPNTALLFDASGNPYYGALVASTVAASPFSLTLLDDTSAAAWLTTLGWSSYMQGLKATTSLSTLVTALGTAPVVAEAIERFVGAPTGRLTLETGVPVSSTDQTGKATIYYTPAGIGRARYPVYDGTNWTEKTFTELSNDTTASATNNAGAAAAGPYQIQDCFVWNNAGTNRLTRGPKWTASATATMTIAVPGVVTWTAHGLWDGATVRFTTTGALPTGLVASTDYFVTKIDANTFNLSTTLANQVAGTKITTSGSQSGVHTVFNYTSVRGTGTATTELQMVNGVYVNKYDITNGPAANRGTYVGSVYFNASSQIDLKFGSTAAGYGEAFVGVWNAYNQVKVAGTVGTSTASWGVSSSQAVFNSSATARVTAISGLAATPLCCHVAGYISCDGATSIGISVAFRARTGANPNISGTYVNNGSASTPFPLHLEYKSVPFLGVGYVVPIDYSTNYTSSYINNNGTSGSYIDYDWRY